MAEERELSTGDTAGSGRALFWQALEHHRGALDAAVSEEIASLPALQALLLEMDPEALRRASQDSAVRQRKALLEGEWAPLLQDMKQQGAFYAQFGIPFEEWFALAGLMRRGLTRGIVGDYLAEPARLEAALHGMCEYFERAMHAVSEGYLAAKQDRLERVLRELERSNRELEDFAYVASHDLRSPLRDIENLASWIEEDCQAVLPEESRRHLSLLRGRVKRMERLLTDLLQYSRAGRLLVEPEAVDVRMAALSAADLAGAPPGFSISVEGDSPEIRSPREPLEVVLRNLISNAVKHHDRPDGRVVVQIEGQAPGDPSRIVVTVSDDGPGIAPQFHERIFRMFQALRPRDEVEGSGMGLAIVRKLVDHYGGDIAVDSAPGRGSAFRFTWPRAWSAPADTVNSPLEVAGS